MAKILKNIKVPTGNICIMQGEKGKIELYSIDTKDYIKRIKMYVYPDPVIGNFILKEFNEKKESSILEYIRLDKWLNHKASVEGYFLQEKDI